MRADAPLTQQQTSACPPDCKRKPQDQRSRQDQRQRRRPLWSRPPHQPSRLPHQSRSLPKSRTATRVSATVRKAATQGTQTIPTRRMTRAHATVDAAGSAIDARAQGVRILSYCVDMGFGYLLGVPGISHQSSQMEMLREVAGGASKMDRRHKETPETERQ